MKEKKSNLVVIVIAMLVLALGGMYLTYQLGIKNQPKCPEEKTVQNNTPTETTTVENPVETVKECVEENYLKTFGESKYNLYSYLNNQGSITVVLAYKGELYRVVEDEDGDCALSVSDSSVKCNTEVGSVDKLNVKTDDVNKVYAIKSNESDGSEYVLVLLTDGTVNRYQFKDGLNIDKDFFKGEKVKDLTKYSCNKKTDNGCSQDKYTVLLTDGSTKEILK